jgi:AcrR family transcriptional regulator
MPRISSSSVKVRRRLPGAERRHQIAEVALSLIARQGAAELTAIGIAERVGVADATLFRHFASMEQIVDAAIDAFEKLLFDGFPPRDAEPLERLRSFFVRRMTVARARPEVLRLAFNDRLAQAAGEAGARRVRDFVERSVRFVRTCLEQARERGQVADDLPIEVLVWTVTGSLRGAGLATGSLLRSEPPERVWQAVETLLRRSADRTKPRARKRGRQQRNSET